jgi:mono/diheme cytochrome c family protein
MMPGIVMCGGLFGLLLIAPGMAERVQGAAARDAAPAMLALGDSVFHGRVGAALCYVCHGPAGKGVAGLGPDLTDKEWLHGDGSTAFIEKTVETGIAKPKKMPAPMPPKGGGQLNESQIKAVAAYVFALSHPTKK